MESPGYRGNVIELLRTIASAERTRDYADLIPGGDVLGELVCQWFDDLYLLAEGHSDVISAETLSRYQHQFNPAELEAMGRFHSFLSERVDLLRQHASAETLLTDPVWKSIMEQAAVALRSFQPAN